LLRRDFAREAQKNQFGPLLGLEATLRESAIAHEITTGFPNVGFRKDPSLRKENREWM
jgi:hypothetical protein